MKSFKFFLALVLLLSSCQSESPSENMSEGHEKESETQELSLETFEWNSAPCSNVTSTPIIVESQLIFSLHDQSLGGGCEEKTEFVDHLILFDLEDKVFTLGPYTKQSEATATYVEELQRIMLPVLSKPGYSLLDSSEENWSLLEKDQSVDAIADSAALFLNGSFFFGTVNTPFPTCQNPVTLDCGGFFKVDAQTGELLDKLNTQDGLRAWMTGAPTSDGKFIYLGTGTGHFGEADEADTYGCSILKLNQNLDILASVDPDEKGCPSHLENGDHAVAGEVVLAEDGLWAQFTRPGDLDNQVALIHYDFDLNELCRVEWPADPSKNSASYYQAPVIDEKGFAYVSWHFQDVNRKDTGIYKVSPDCENQMLKTFDVPLMSSLSLADNSHVLVVNQYTLYGLDKETGEVLFEVPLETQSSTVGSPVIHNGEIYILSSDGTLSLIRHSGLENYGDAMWPRFRKDNWGSATTTLL